MLRISGDQEEERRRIISSIVNPTGEKVQLPAVLPADIQEGWRNQESWRCGKVDGCGLHARDAFPPRGPSSVESEPFPGAQGLEAFPAQRRDNAPQIRPHFPPAIPGDM